MMELQQETYRQVTPRTRPKPCQWGVGPDALNTAVCGAPAYLQVETIVRGKIPCCTQCILESKGYITPDRVSTLR